MVHANSKNNKVEYSGYSEKLQFTQANYPEKLSKFQPWYSKKLELLSFSEVWTICAPN